MSEFKSFKSPVYDQLDTSVTKELGLPDGLLHSIRLNGERSNADQVSSAGARTVYQFIPQTRKAILDKYGIDVYLNPKNAAKGAGLLLKEGLDRNKGDVRAAVGEYTGGLNRSNWGKVTKSYIARVVDSMLPTAQAGEMPSNNDADLLAKMDTYKPTANTNQPATTQPAQAASSDDELLAKMDDWNAQNNHPHPTQEQLDAAKNHTFKDDLVQTLQENPIGAKLAAFADPVTSLYQGAKQLFGADNKQDIKNVKTIRDENPMSALAGNVASYAVGGMAAPAINTVKGAAAVGAGSGFLQPTADNSMTDRLVNAGVGGAAGAAGAAIANGASKYIGGKLADNAIAKTTNATRDATLKDAVSAGYIIPPSLAEAGTTARTVEGLTGSARMARTAMDTNQKVTNSLANEYLGLPKTVSLSDDVIQSLKAPHNAVYEEVANLPDTLITNQAPKKANSDYLLRNDTTSYIANGRELLDKLKEARDVSRSAWKSFNSGTASNPTELLKTAKNADIEASQLEKDIWQIAAKSGPTNLLENLKNSRRELAKINTIDKVFNETTGDVNAIALSKLAQKGAPLDGAARKIANFGRAYGKIARVPADGNSAAFTAVDAGLMGGGMGAGNPLLAALPMARVAGRSTMLSKPVQNAMANKSYALNPSQQFIDAILANKYAPMGLTGGLLQLNK